MFTNGSRYRLGAPSCTTTSVLLGKLCNTLTLLQWLGSNYHNPFLNAPGFLQLLAPNGQPLRVGATLEAALRDGELLTALVKAPRLKATRWGGEAVENGEF